MKKFFQKLCYSDKVHDGSQTKELMQSFVESTHFYTQFKSNK